MSDNFFVQHPEVMEYIMKHEAAAREIEQEQRVVRHANGKYYPQQYIIGTHGLDWYYFPEYKGYKTERGAINALPQRGTK